MLLYCAILQYCNIISIAILQYCSVAVLQCCSVAVLRCCSVAVLRYCSIAILQCCGIAVLRFCSVAVLQYCVIAVLRCCSVAFYLYTSTWLVSYKLINLPIPKFYATLQNLALWLVSLGHAYGSGFYIFHILCHKIFFLGNFGKLLHGFKPINFQVHFWHACKKKHLW